MSALPLPVHDENAELTITILEEVFSGITRDFSVRLWDGSTMPPAAGRRPKFTLILNHPGALRNMFWEGTEVGLGEAYIFGDCDVEGDMEAAVEMGFVLAGALEGARKRWQLRALLLRLPRNKRELRRAPELHGGTHTRERDRDAIRYHYDMAPEFYQLFLDRRMMYSAACFANPNDDLERAQEKKLQNICRELELQPGQRLLDIGCGWGGLIAYAAQNFGVEAFGITLSGRQAEVARGRILAAGLGDRCRAEVRDYRDLPDSGSFDKIASIGMVEHVGARHLPEYFGQTFRLLRPGGAFLNRGICRPEDGAKKHSKSFTEEYVFPDGELEPIHEMLGAAENAGFAVRSVENLREYYAETLRHWVRRLESNAGKARQLAGDVTYRIWRLYMAGSAANFSAGRLHLFQTLLRKPSA